MKPCPWTIEITAQKLAKQYKTYQQACKQFGIRKPLSLKEFADINGYKVVEGPTLIEGGSDITPKPKEVEFDKKPAGEKDGQRPPP